MLDNVPCGTHLAIVERVEFFKSSRKGTPGLKVLFTLPELHTGGECDIWLSEKAIGMARHQLRKLGYNPDTGSLRELASDPLRLKGAEFDVSIEEEEYMGKFRKRAQIPTPRNDGLKVDEIMDLDVLLKAGAAKDKAPPAPAEPSPANDTWDNMPSDDDIPF